MRSKLTRIVAFLNLLCLLFITLLQNSILSSTKNEITVNCKDFPEDENVFLYRSKTSEVLGLLKPNSFILQTCFTILLFIIVYFSNFTTLIFYFNESK